MNRLDPTLKLLLYGVFSSILLLVASFTPLLNGLGNFESIALAFIFCAFLSNILFSYQWKAANWAKWLVTGVSLGIILPIAGQVNGFLFELAIQIGIFAALALGLNIVVGLAGLLDLGYVAFFAAGAYLWGIFGSPQLGQILGQPEIQGVGGGYFWLFLIGAVLVAALMGVLIGLPVLKLKGDYLAIVTLGLGEVIRVLANNLIPITNGPIGIIDIQRPSLTWIQGLTQLLNISEAQLFSLFLYFLVLVIIIIVIVANVRLDNSRIGRSWIAIREDEIAAQAMGISLVYTKLLAFATGASFAGVMGAIFAAKQMFISPESFSFFQSIGVLSMVILGGMGSIPGVILGATLVTLLNLDILKALSETLKGLNLPTELDPAKYERLVFGIILIAMMIFRPEGLLPAKRRQAEIHQHEEQK